jgi:hypothetical protein
MRRIVALLFLIVVCIPIQTASAHFIVSSSDNTISAEFHATPNHQPVAGQNSVISFDFSQGSDNIRDFTYLLRVKNTQNKLTDVQTTIEGSTVLANYTFPNRGVYTIILTAQPKDTTLSTASLRYTQRVNKGTPAPTAPLQIIELLVIGVTLGVAIIAAIATVVITAKRKRVL